MNFLEIKTKVDAAFKQHIPKNEINEHEMPSIDAPSEPVFSESSSIESHVGNLVSKHFNKSLNHSRKKLNTSVKKAGDKMSQSTHKITRIAGKLVKKMAEEVETSGQDESRAVAEIGAAATMHGGTLSEYADGVGIIDFRKKAALEDFLAYMDDNDLIDDFEVHAHIHDEDDGTIEDIDLDQIDDDLHVDFVVTFYLFPDLVEYEPEDEDEYEEYEEGFTVDELTKMSKFYQGSRKQIFENAIDRTNPALTIKKLRAIGARDGVISEHAPREIQESKDFINDLVSLINSKENVLAAEYIAENFVPSVYVTSDKTVSEFIKLHESDETLMEVLRKIKVNSRGTRRVKMQCNRGFKWNSSTRSCEKITGAELMTMRKSIRKALITKRSMGSAYKVRVHRKTMKADRYRKSMGLK